MKKYDLIVIGSGPAGEKAAVKAAYFGYKVAIIEKDELYGGAMVQTGTLPSKTLRETALYLSGKYEKELYTVDRVLSKEASIQDFLFREKLISKREGKDIELNLKLHKIDIFKGTASFEDQSTILIQTFSGKEYIAGNHIIIATGSYPYHPPSIPFDGVRIHDSDTILNISHFPQSLCIVGAGVIGCEYATIFATMGTKVYLINNKDRILPFVDAEITRELLEQMQKQDITTFFNCNIEKISYKDDLIDVKLSNHENLQVDMFLFAAGRNGNIKHLNLEKIGIKTGPRETIMVNQKYQTNISHIYAVGDVIGFPALASTSMDQGRIAVAHIFQTKDLLNLSRYFPYGIYSIPEISTVSITEEEATAQHVNFCIGKAYYKDMARGKIMGMDQGFLKLIFKKDKNNPLILAVHIIGPLASEIIHFGLSLVENKKNLFDVINTVVNYPTLHDLYKYAAYDGLSNLTGHKVKL